MALPEQLTSQSPEQVTSQALDPVHVTLLPLPTLKMHWALPVHVAEQEAPQDRSQA